MTKSPEVNVSNGALFRTVGPIDHEGALWLSACPGPPDESYSLLGIFDISLPMLYGDGAKAFMTLQEAIVQKYEDQSIFAWDIDLDKPAPGIREGTAQTQVRGMLAQSPAAFAKCGLVE